jgi:spore germination protein YaaH
MKQILFWVVLICSGQSLLAQVPDSEHISIHQLQSTLYRSKGDSLLRQQQPSWATPSPLLMTKKLELSRKVLGWHPYWAASTAYQKYDYEVLTHIAYFSYETDTVTGGYLTINGWDQTPIIDYAHQRGVKVLLTVTNMGTAANTALLRDTVRQKKMISTVITLLKSRNGDGVNFDLELVSLSMRANLVSFITRAVKSIKAELPNAEISMASPAVDWSGSWNLAALAQVCDYLIVMGYDYYYSGSATAGPVAPLEGESYNITKSVDTYINAGVPSKKLMLGTPWYGYNWPVSSTVRKAPATGKGVAVIYPNAENLATTYGKTFDQTTKVPWISYKDASNILHQVWYDDATSYSYKYDLVNSKGLAGIGIWALSYESGDVTMWNVIKNAFSTTGIEDLSVIPKDPFNFIVYPNPVNGIANISFTLSTHQKVEMNLTDINGRLLHSVINKELPADKYLSTLDCSRLNKGFYLLVFKTINGNLTRKIIVE